MNRACETVEFLMTRNLHSINQGNGVASLHKDFILNTVFKKNITKKMTYNAQKKKQKVQLVIKSCI